jgi:phosphate transport system substrate-binding protein
MSTQLAAILATWCVLTVCSVASASEYIDTPGQDPDAACHGAGTIDTEALRKSRTAAVFTVLVTENGQLEPKGTASLVDSDRGIFATAAHVVHFSRDLPIFVSQKLKGQGSARKFQVHVFPTVSATDDWDQEDFALLQADQWTASAQMLAFPFRIDSVDEYIAGFFIGQAKDMANSVFGEFGIAFGESSSEFTYKGTVFPHASGALLLDGRGRAFALILHDAKIENRLIDGIKMDQLRRILWEADHFSAFPLRGVLGKLKAIPATGAAQKLIDRLNKLGDDEEFKFGLQRSTLTAVDTIHLTDSVVSADVWHRLESQHLIADILMRMMPVVQMACTHKYFSEEFARRAEEKHTESYGSIVKRASASSVGVQIAEDSGVDPKTAQSAEVNPLKASVGQFGDMPTQAAKAAGIMFLREALSASGKGADVTRIQQARLAAMLLRRAAEEPKLRQAISASTRNREYAALMANLALAEDLLGDQVDAQQAMISSDALGGSPVAYDLAARYAIDQHDESAAAALYARAYAMLSTEDPDRALRAAIKSKFDAVIAADPSIGTVRIDAFNFQVAKSDTHGRWYEAFAGGPADRTVKFIVDVSGLEPVSLVPVYTKWVDAYKRETGIGIDYQALRNDDNLSSFHSATYKQPYGAKSATFGVSDLPLRRKELLDRGLVQFPLVMRAVVPVVNLVGVKPGELVLNGSVLAKIFTGQIRSWNHDAIRELNPALTLPPEPILVVRRADDKSSVNVVFQDYLQGTSRRWYLPWGGYVVGGNDVGIAMEGNDGVAELVASIEGAIGYIEFPYSKKINLSYVRLVNKAGKVVEPSEAAFMQAAVNSEWANPPNFAGKLSTPSGDDSWPIVAPTFVVMNKRPSDPKAAAEALHFFAWAYKNGDKAAEESAIVTMPESVADMVQSVWNSEIKDVSQSSNSAKH